jgi:putative ABC transport system permease protein
MFYLKLGFRNIIKNIRKTLLTMATLVVGMAALLVFSGANSYQFKHFREDQINTEYGHFQVYEKGYLQNGKDYPFDYLIPDYAKALEEFKKIPGVKFVAPRLSFSGIISGDNVSTVIIGTAGSPGEENLMNSSPITNGAFISTEDQSGIVAGDGLLEKLSGGLGDDFTIMATMKGGGINGMDAVVRGVRKGYGEFDQLGKMFVLANLDRVQRLLNVGASVDRLIIMLDRTEDVEKIEPRIRDLCERLGLEYRRWDDLAVFYKSAKAMYDMDMLILTIIILSILIFIIANTMSMNLLERIREIGTIRALGTTRTQVSGIFLAESTLIGIIGSITGIAAGMILAVLINIFGGIYHAPNIFMPKGYFALVVPEISGVLAYFFLFIVVALVAAYGTARKASKMSIADSLRWI